MTTLDGHNSSNMWSYCKDVVNCMANSSLKYGKVQDTFVSYD